MQLSPNADLWLRIASIAVPVIITPIVTYLVINRNQSKLNKELEGYKKELSKEIEDYKEAINLRLESHKQQLQSGFQHRFYEFQTKYSLLHQKQADVFEKLFELIARVFNDLQILQDWDVVSFAKEPKSKFLSNARDHLDQLAYFHDEKRIYFNDDIGKKVREIVRTAHNLLSEHFDLLELAKKNSPDTALRLKQSAGKLIHENINGLMNELVVIFKQLLSAESANTSFMPKRNQPPKS